MVSIGVSAPLDCQIHPFSVSIIQPFLTGRQHAISRSSISKPRSEEDRRIQKSRIDTYLALVSQVNQKVKAKCNDRELLDLTSKLLAENPEFYTVWNHRRRILISWMTKSKTSSQDDLEASTKEISGYIVTDLRFLLPLLQKFPKCYWLWNHRSWLLKQSESFLPLEVAIRFWAEEMGLVNKMLGRDGRNFHAWGYRREVVTQLERLDRENGGSGDKTAEEYEYTRKMIGKDLSNFSAWHARSKLLLRLAREKGPSFSERQRMLDEELELIHEALIDPKDQSLWYYHQFLRTTFESESGNQCVVPDLPIDERLNYLQTEVDYVMEMLEDCEDVKWVYIALVELSTMYNKQGNGQWPQGVNADKVKQWLYRVNDLDPLRKDRWADLLERLK